MCLQDMLLSQENIVHTILDSRQANQVQLFIINFCAVLRKYGCSSTHPREPWVLEIWLRLEPSFKLV